MNIHQRRRKGKKGISRQQTLCRFSKVVTTQAAKNRADGSLSGVRSMEAKGQARHVFSSIPAYT